MAKEATADPTPCRVCGGTLAAEVVFCPFCGASRAPLESRVAQPLIGSSAELTVPPVTVADAARTAEPSGPSTPGATDQRPVVAVSPSPSPGGQRPQPTLPNVAGKPSAWQWVGGLLLLAVTVSLVQRCARNDVSAPVGQTSAPVSAGVELSATSTFVRAGADWGLVDLGALGGPGTEWALQTDAPVRVRADGRVYLIEPGRRIAIPPLGSAQLELRTVQPSGANVTVYTEPR